MQTKLKGVKDFKVIMAKTKDLLGLSKELNILNTNKKALLCGLDKCRQEYVDVTAIRNKKLGDLVEKTRKMFK